MQWAVILSPLIIVLAALFLVLRSRRTMHMAQQPGSSCDTVPSGQPFVSRSHCMGNVGDYLKLVGMRVCFWIKPGEFYTGEVVDLSDSGTHVILRDVHYNTDGKPTVCFDKKNIPIADIDLIEVQDRHGREA